MSILKIKLAPLIIIEDDRNKNIIPLVLELIQQQHEKHTWNLFCYEQPASLWRGIFTKQPNVQYYEEFNATILNGISSSNETHSVMVDSVNQMSLSLGWAECLKYLKRLHSHPNIKQVILVLHTDCLSHHSKLRICLNHMASAIVSYDTDPCKIRVQLKKSGKVTRTEEILSYDSLASTLKSTPIVKQEKQEEEPERPLPENLTTFKIEARQTEKLEKYKLKLPYMSKINEGQSKVYYEPDAVDDWDEEDPDEDLDI